MTADTARDVAEVEASVPVRRRVTGVDVARAVAILGMVTVHFGPYPVRETGAAAWLYGSFYGKASVLFVLVAGVGVALMHRRRPARLVRARLWYRTVWLLPVGLWLQGLDHPVAVILQYYALYFLLLSPFVGRRDRTVLGWAIVLLPIGSAVVLWAHVMMPEAVLPLGGRASGGLLGELLVFGYYPVVTWMSPMLVGLWVGRRDLTSPRVQRTLVAVGAALLVGTTLLGRGLQTLLGVVPDERAWSWILSVRGHAEMPLAVVGEIGFALAVLGTALLVAHRWPRLLRPLGALGEVALSVYVGHLLVFATVPDLFPADTVAEGIRTVAAFGAVCAALAVAWLAVAKRGPLETAEHWPWRTVVSPMVASAGGAPRPGSPDRRDG